MVTTTASPVCALETQFVVSTVPSGDSAFWTCLVNSAKPSGSVMSNASLSTLVCAIAGTASANTTTSIALENFMVGTFICGGSSSWFRSEHGTQSEYFTD